MNPASAVAQTGAVQSECIRVAVGVIISVNADSVLLSRRPVDAHQGGLWEFPGGKLEPGEDELHALGRELREEIGVTVLRSEPLIDIAHDYADKSVLLHVRLVHEISGKPRGREGQPLCWVGIDDLHTIALPQANRVIVEALQSRYCK